MDEVHQVNFLRIENNSDKAIFFARKVLDKSCWAHSFEKKC